MSEGNKASAGEELLKEIVERLKAVERRAEQNGKMLRILQEVVVNGTGEALPWHKLKPARMRQVQAVVEFLREYPRCSIRHAAKRTFTKAEGGYKDAENLASYCYDHKVKMYV